MITREIGPSSERSELGNKRRREMNIGLPQVNRVRGRMRQEHWVINLRREARASLQKRTKNWRWG
jgi:hypothetical protein